MMRRYCRVVLEGVQNIQSQLNLKQAAINKRGRTLAVKTSPNSDDVIFGGPDCAFRAVRFFLVGINDIPLKKLEFFMRHLKGRWNMSDFFTKPLPRDKFEQFIPYIVVEVDPSLNQLKISTVVLHKLL